MKTLLFSSIVTYFLELLNWKFKMVWCLNQWRLWGSLQFHKVHFFCSQFSSVIQLCLLRPHGLQHARPPYPSPTPGVYPNSCPLSWWCHPTISSSVAHSPALNPSQHQGLFQWIGSLNQVAKVMELQLQHQSFQWIFRTDLL